MNHLSIIILAAGNGKRMHSQLPKVLHPIAGVPMLERVVSTASLLNPEKILVVYGANLAISEELSHANVEWVHQATPLGTAHAVLQAVAQVEERQNVLVLYGDVPLISKETLMRLIQAVPEKGLGLLVAHFHDPVGFGRILRDELGHIVGIVEEKDATESQRKIQEINTGIMLVPAAYLKKCLPQIGNQNVQKEYYLTDIIAQAKADGYPIKGIMVSDHNEVRGVNTIKELVHLERAYYYQLACKYLEQGVLVKDPNRFDLRGNLKVAEGVTIDVNVIFEEEVELGANCHIGAGVHLRNVKLGEGVTVKPYSYIEGADIQAGSVIGPFSRVRPGTSLGRNVKIGNFVEVKNTIMGDGSKASHLAYLGDCEMGDQVNIGAGTITCNYNGKAKHKTYIHSGAFIGSDVQLVAPVTVHANAVVGAGSTITGDVPEGMLVIARSRQVVVGERDKNKKK